MGKKQRVIGLMALVLIGGLSVAGMWWSEWRFVESTDNAYVHSDITLISPKVSGYVARVLAEDNQTVRQNDPLVRIEDAEYRARLDEASAAVAARSAAIVSLDTRAELQTSLIAQATAEVAVVEAELRRAQQQYERASNLVRDNVGTRKAFDDATAELRKAEATLTRAQAQLEAQKRQLAVIESERQQARALLAQAEAARAVAAESLEGTVIRAPISGVVGNRAVRDGQFVRAGTTLMAVVPLDRVWVVANFKETQLARMQPGQPVTIRVDAFPGTPVLGRVESLSPASGAQFSLLPPENASGNFTKIVQRVPVRIALPPNHPLAGRLRPGLSVEVEVDTRGGESSSVAEATPTKTVRR